MKTTICQYDRRIILQHCRSAFSILELVLTLVIVVLVLTAVLGILNRTEARMRYLDEYFSLQQRAEDCLDRIMDDVLNASGGGMTLDVQQETVGSMNTARLIIRSTMDIETVADSNQPPDTHMSAEEKTGTLRIDWVAVPRYEQDDLVLFRREKYVGVEDESHQDVYLPVCEHLCEFDVRVVDDKDESTENMEQARSVEVFIRLFRPNESDSECSVLLSRSFCLRRFE